MTGAGRVVAVIVTYGARSNLCIRSAQAALTAGLDDVVIVSNGSAAQDLAALNEFATANAGIGIVDLPSNAGSAAGFGRGIQYALARESCRYLWLLDDDNEPKPNALKELVREAERRESAGSSSFALLSLRPERPLLRALAAGRTVRDTFPSRSCFLNFNVVDIPRRVRRRHENRLPVEGCVSGLPYGPFGGLFLPRSLAQRLGLPDERLVVYEDDTDFTSRIRDVGADLALVTRSLIDEQVPAWYAAATGRGPQRLLTARSELRVYYSVRNRVYFETTRWRGSSLLYAVNKAVVLTIVLVSGARPKSWARIRLVLRAIRDGESGRLGRPLELEGSA